MAGRSERRNLAAMFVHLERFKSAIGEILSQCPPSVGCWNRGCGLGTSLYKGTSTGPIELRNHNKSLQEFKGMP